VVVVYFNVTIPEKKFSKGKDLDAHLKAIRDDAKVPRVKACIRKIIAWKGRTTLEHVVDYTGLRPAAVRKALDEMVVAGDLKREEW